MEPSRERIVRRGLGGRGRRLRLGGVAAALLAGAVGCAVADGPVQDTGGGVTDLEQRVELVGDRGGRGYRALALAPDPCFRVPEEAETAVEGTTFVVTRALIREPGICAAVITPIEVTGDLPDLPGGVDAFTLRLRDDRGRTVFEASTPL